MWHRLRHPHYRPHQSIHQRHPRRHPLIAYYTAPARQSRRYHRPSLFHHYLPATVLRKLLLNRHYPPLQLRT